MTLQDIYDSLQSGELSQHPLFCDGLGVENYPVINRAINDALVNLYGRFPLKTRQLTLVMSEVITQYYFKKEYAVTDSTEGYPKYIDDTPAFPFTGDLSKVIAVSDEGGCNIPMNDGSTCYSVFTTTNESLMITNPVEGEALFVTYLARHPSITGDSKPTTELELPIGLVPALCAYVGYKLYSGKTDQVGVAKSNSLLAQFEGLCSQQDMFGLTNRDDGTISPVFSNRGWV